MRKWPLSRSQSGEDVGMVAREGHSRYTDPGERRTFRCRRNHKIPVEPDLKNYKYWQVVEPLGAKELSGFSNLLLLAVETFTQ